MRIAQTETAIESYHAHTGKERQCARILGHIKQHGGDWSIGEIAHALGMEKSTVSPRIRELLDTDELEAKPNRKDRRSGIRIRPVGLPVVGQQVLF